MIAAALVTSVLLGAGLCVAGLPSIGAYLMLGGAVGAIMIVPSSPAVRWHSSFTESEHRQLNSVVRAFEAVGLEKRFSDGTSIRLVHQRAWSKTTSGS